MSAYGGEALDALYVDVEDAVRERTDTWPTSGPGGVSEVELLMRYEQELRCRGYDAGEWGEARVPLIRPATGTSLAFLLS